MFSHLAQQHKQYHNIFGMNESDKIMSTYIRDQIVSVTRSKILQSHSKRQRERDRQAREGERRGQEREEQGREGERQARGRET